MLSKFYDYLLVNRNYFFCDKYKKNFWISQDPYRSNKLNYFVNYLDLANRYIDVLGNAAPRFSLHQTALMEAKDYKQLDALHKKVRFDPVYSERAVLSPGGNMVADGPNALVILRSLGLDAGPPFPGQADVSPAFTEYINKQTEASGIMDWVDWDQEALFKGV